MDSMQAFAKGATAKAQGARQRVFDWDKAARLIAERKPDRASAGLSGDWEWTGGTIWTDGKPVPAEDTYTYLSSNWATPELDLDGDVVECWIWEDNTEWDAGTYWPDSARSIVAE